ncbi:hypothetical protein LT679_07150 [Mucilaginibacter roseus]|uniref:Peptidase M23 n=1 Tax=Mucilaginibacter roseus TaxID=1528868 RepID=A0ABS8TZS8_9SPHI|nr:hypothetical protein [Mucilaginibacter roseus]MCD8740374.1 hypothetical protein [Mucilaginibacter roseus]
MTNIEHKEIKGITLKNLIVTVFSMISIVVSVMGTYFKLQIDLSELKTEQAAQSRISEVRLKVLEEQVALLQQQMKEIIISKNEYNRNFK